MKVYRDCRTCEGLGTYEARDERREPWCPACGGTGVVPIHPETLRATIELAIERADRYEVGYTSMAMAVIDAIDAIEDFARRRKENGS